MASKTQENTLGLFRKLRAARRKRGMTQSALAKAVDCRQSAISMMENGRSDAVSKAVLQQIAGLLDVVMEDESLPNPTGNAYCPDPECPSNFPMEIRGDVIFWPAGNTGDGRFCRFCGEVLERNCPNPECYAPAESTACCRHCGTPLITASLNALQNPGEWVRNRRREIEQLFHFMNNRLPGDMPDLK